MNERERLIELLNDMQDKGYVQARDEDEISCHVSNKNIAQYLLENRVIVPPCKVGDVVYAQKSCFYLPHATQIKSDAIIAYEVIAIKETKKG